MAALETMTGTKPSRQKRPRILPKHGACILILLPVLILQYLRFHAHIFQFHARDGKKNVMPGYNEITFTHYGWFHPDSQEGLKVARTFVAKEFMEAVVAHERYNESAWEDLEKNPDPSRPILAFLDIDTCNDIHWPKFGGDWEINSDTAGGRQPLKSWADSFGAVCPLVERALKSPAMAAPGSRLFILSCEGHGPLEAKCTGVDRDKKVFAKLVVGHMSAHKNQTHRHDFGIPPLPVKPVALNQTQLNNIRSCHFNTRKYLLSFTGRGRIPFPEFEEYMVPLHGKNGVYAVFQWDHYVKNPVENAWGGKVVSPLPPENQTQDIYYRLLMDSVFAASPRGDNLYSVRLAEILSAAAVPVIYADGWVLPYTKDVVDWSELAVILPQRKVNQTLDVLQSISDEERCLMQQRILTFYQQYVADSTGRLQGVLKILDARLNRASKDITNFTSAR